MKKYKLGTIEKDHIELIRKWRNEQIEILRQTKPISYAEQEEYFSKLNKDDKVILFSILDQKDKLLAYCGLVNINYVNETAELSFLANTGIAKTNTYSDLFLFVLKELVKYAFDTLNLHKVWTETYAFRDKHIEILESFGMTKEGVLREHVYYKGKRYSSIIHSILRDERKW